MLGTIAVGAIVALVIGLALRSTIRSRKSGGCGCGCAGCDQSKNCH